MILLPYYTKDTPITGTHATIRTIFLLTVGGKEVWEEEDVLRIVEDVLEPNGLYLSANTVPRCVSDDMDRGSIYACPIDPIRTAVHDFYRWSELPKEDDTTICWRPFYRCGSTPIPVHETLSGIPMKTICGWIDPSFCVEDAMERFNLNT